MLPLSGKDPETCGHELVSLFPLTCLKTVQSQGYQPLLPCKPWKMLKSWFPQFYKWDWWFSLPYHSQCIDSFYWGSVQILWLRKRDLAMREYTSEPLPSRSFCCGSILRSCVKYLCSMWFFCSDVGPFHPSYSGAPLTFNILMRRTSF